MSTRVRDRMMGGLEHLRHEPTEKRVRAMLGSRAVVDSTRVMLVWEPWRVVPSYAVPAEDVRGDLVPATSGAAGATAAGAMAAGGVAAAPEQRPTGSGSRGPVILHPGISFSVHSTDGEALGVRVAGQTRDGVAFRPADPDLAGYVVLDFNGFDAWYEEDEPVVAHPRDPFHRVDIRRSSRPVRIELDGQILAESSRPTLLFETSLPARFYLPRDDVRADLRPSAKRTHCAYKGEASYWSLDVSGRTFGDLAWSYQRPLPEAAAVTGLIAFFDEKVDVVLDGERRSRPRTPFSLAIIEEVGG